MQDITDDEISVWTSSLSPSKAFAAAGKMEDQDQQWRRAAEGGESTSARRPSLTSPRPTAPQLASPTPSSVCTPLPYHNVPSEHMTPEPIIRPMMKARVQASKRLESQLKLEDQRQRAALGKTKVDNASLKPECESSMPGHADMDNMTALDRVIASAGGAMPSMDAVPEEGASAPCPEPAVPPDASKPAKRKTKGPLEDAMRAFMALKKEQGVKYHEALSQWKTSSARMEIVGTFSEAERKKRRY